MLLLPRGARRPAFASAAIALLAALVVIGAVALLGPPASSRFAGHDARFAVAALSELHAAWATVPGVPPGWLGGFFGGLGAPVFLFYPPLAFLLAGGFARLGVEEVSGQLAAALLVARLAGMAACYAWIRGFAGRPAALLGAAAFALFPYNSLVNPIIRSAFAEGVANGLLPCLVLAIAAPLSPHRRVAAIAVALAAIGATHVPTALMAMICGGAYALGLGVSRATEAMVGFALGLALLAFHLVPALLLGPEISTAAMMDQGHSWRGTMLFWGMAGAQKTSLLGMLYALFALAAATALLAWRAAPAGPQPRAVLLGALCSLAFATPLTLPAWALLPPMDYIQFPWRFLSPAGLFFAAQVALLAEAAGRAGRPRLQALVGLGVTLLALAPPAFLGAVAAAKPADRVSFPGAAAAALLAGSGYPGPPEYLPRAAREAGWLPFLRDNRMPPGLPSAPEVLEGAARPDATHHEPGRLHLAGRAEGPATLRLPLLSFPGWAVSDGGTLGVDWRTGLVTVSVPPGEFDLVVRRQPLPVTMRAALASALVLLGVLALAALPAGRGVAGLRPARDVRAAR